ncbi:hypothetical protein PG995_004398 [Apiospora arundinis]
MSAPEAPKVDLSEDRSGELKAFAIAMTVMTVVSISLRFWSRGLSNLVPGSRHQARFWWDDWFALAAVPFILAQFAIEFAMMDIGLGRHIQAIDQSKLPLFLKMLYSEYFIYDAALFLAKTSALLFLSRIFPKYTNAKWWNAAVIIGHVLNIGWFLGIVFGTVFMCYPVEKGWNPMAPGNCGPTNALWIGSAIPSVAIDLVILLLPLPKIWTLQMNKAQRAGLMVVFALGYCVIIVSLGRMITLLIGNNGLDTDITYASIPITMWVSAEAPVLMLCICLPALLPLGRHLSSTFLYPLASKMSSMFSTNKTKTDHSTVQGSAADHYYSRTDPDLEANTKMRSLKPTAAVGHQRLGSDARSIGSASSTNGMLRSYGSYSANAQAVEAVDMSDNRLPGQAIRVDKDVNVVRRGN